MRSIIVIIVLLSGLLNAHSDTTTNWSRRIVSTTKHPWRYWVSHCGQTINELIIGGKRFKNVRGLSKFYLQVPNTNIIVFITDEPDYSVTYHLFNMNTVEDTAIAAKGSVFGHDIGSKTISDFVNVDSEGRIRLVHLEKYATSTLQSSTNLDTVKSIYILDKSKKIVVAQKICFYDKAGNLIREHNESPSF